MSSQQLEIQKNQTKLTLARFDSELELEISDWRDHQQLTLYLTESQVKEIIDHLSKAIARLPVILS